MNDNSPGVSNKTKQLIIGISTLLAVLIVVGALVIGKQADSAAGDTPATTNAPQKVTNASSYKDGTYKSSGAYMSPGGDEQIDVTVTIKDNAVTDSSISQDPSAPDARRYQSEFADNYKQYVVGKKLNDIKLSHVSGSSLTSIGFNQALEQIKQQAEQS